MSKKLNIAVVGATGNVGLKILAILKERNFPINEIHVLASRKSVGKKVSFGEDDVITVKSLEDFTFTNIDIVFSCVSSDVVKLYIEKAINAGAIIIDKSSLFRQDSNVPLVVPEVNMHLISDTIKSRIIASPNCCVIPLVTATSPLHDAAKIKRIVISTYQSVSGAGKDYMDELYNQTKSTFLASKLRASKFEKQIAFNIIPKIDQFNANGDTLEEEKLCNEIKKILGNTIQVSATCVRVPVFIGHALSVNIEFENKISSIEAEEILAESEGIVLIKRDSTTQYITPVESVGEDTVYVCRIRDDTSRPNSLNMWIVSDNLRNGSATNAVQIAECVGKLL